VSERRPANGVRRGKKVAEVTAREIIKDAMRDGLEPGSRLQAENDMLERFGVGRGSLREALRILEVQGLLTIRTGPGGGPTLAHVSNRDFGRMATLYFMAAGVTYREVIEARIAMTVLMARLAAERSAPAGVDELRLLVDSAEQHADGEPETWVTYTTAFYTKIGDLCENRVVAMSCLAFMSIWVEHLPRLPYPPEYRATIIAAHGEIADAITDGDGERSERLMREHMDRFGDRVREAYPMFLDQVVDWE
jgi:GntR family transcriptional regulator, transcriptional repressor for pyruvate dehydrogenase complex